MEGFGKHEVGLEVTEYSNCVTQVQTALILPISFGGFFLITLRGFPGFNKYFNFTIYRVKCFLTLVIFS